MKVCLAATLLALLLNYLALSEGALSPPLNLSVELLDFRALAHWRPGPGNPEGTRYSLEFIDLEHFSSTWNQTRDCTNITSMQCSLSLNQRILSEYFMRVGAKWEEERSAWTCLPRSIQPYKYTLLSAPDLTVLAEQHSIRISLSHPVQSLMDVQMRFTVSLFQMISNSSAEKHIAQSITTKSASFVNLPSGNYCINVSAFLTAEVPKSDNATRCVFLHHDHSEGKLRVVIVGVFLLLSIPAIVGLIIIIHCYTKPPRISYKPKALQIITATGPVPTFNSEEHRAFPLSRIFIDKCTALNHKTVENSSQGYFQRKGVRRGSRKKIKESRLSNNEDDEDQDLRPVSDFYSTAAKMEESEECMTETEYRSFGLTPKATSFSDMSLPIRQKTEMGNTFDPVLDEFDENFRTSRYIEQTDSSESETESLGSDDVYGSNYEPRPDPWLMCNL